MTITLNVNPKELDTEGFSVSDLIDALGMAGHPVLIELNGEALLSKEFPNRQVTEGAAVEIIRMVAGG